MVSSCAYIGCKRPLDEMPEGGKPEDAGKWCKIRREWWIGKNTWTVRSWKVHQYCAKRIEENNLSRPSEVKDTKQTDGHNKGFIKVSVEIPTFDECPACHEKKLIRAEGCVKCAKCDWSACSSG